MHRPNFTKLGMPLCNFLVVSKHPHLAPARLLRGGEEDGDGKEEEELSDRSILRIKWGAIRVCARPI